MAAPRYVPCPTCGHSATDTLVTMSIKRRFAMFECPVCRTMYAAHFQRNGLLREIRKSTA